MAYLKLIYLFVNVLISVNEFFYPGNVYCHRTVIKKGHLNFNAMCCYDFVFWHNYYPGIIIKTIVMIIYVKNMISQRCKIVVNNILQGLGLQAKEVMIGEIELNENVPDFKLMQLNAALKATGLELIFDRKDQLVQQIKNIILEIIHFSPEPLALKFSCYLSKRLNYNYTYLSGVFKKLNGITI
jgi:hypothetical protein